MQQGNSWKYQNDSFPILSVERIPRSFLRKGSGSSCCGTCAKNISILKEKQLKSIDCRLEKQRERERERQSAIRRSVTGNEPHMPREEVPPVLYEWDEAQTQVLETGLSRSMQMIRESSQLSRVAHARPWPRMFRGSLPAVDPQAVCPPVFFVCVTTAIVRFHARLIPVDGKATFVCRLVNSYHRFPLFHG